MRKNIPILLVEDDQIDQQTVARAFRKNKITNSLFIVENGKEALAYLRHEGPYGDPQKAPRPGIILLDLHMPIMNGMELLTILKQDEDLKSIPVVVLTTSQKENDQVESFRLSVAGYVIKPLEFGDFVDAIKTIDLYWTLSELC